jgi:phosphoribosylamine--glycine ligase
VLYAGLMLDLAGNPNLIEFNCRLGDPEAQVILPRVSSGLLEAFHASAQAKPLPRLELSSASAVTTVLAAAGYPGEPKRDDPIRIPDNLPESTILFHGATQRDEAGRLRTNGGRVLAVTAVAASFRAAQNTSRAVAEAIEFEGKQMRTDIGWREARRLGLGG